MTWTGIFGLMGALIAIGTGVDRLMVLSGRRRLYDALTRLWFFLDSVQISDLSRLLAEKVLLRAARLRSRPVTALSLGVLSSIALTTFAAVSGRMIRSRLFHYDAAAGMPIAEMALTHVEWLYQRSSIYSRAYFVNAVFDALTVALTLQALKKYVAARTTIEGISWLALNVVAAYVLAVTCLDTSYVFVGSRPYTGTLWSNFDVANHAVFHVLVCSFDVRTAYIMDDAFYATTTLVPTIVYFAVTVALVLSKVVAGTACRAGKYATELLVEPAPQEVEEKFKPFALLGVFCGLLVVTAKAIREVILVLV